MTIFSLGTLILVLIIVGIWEYQLHKVVLSKLPNRIHVNGSRGKSSVVRLIAAGLRAGGFKTLAKVTGTSPRVIDKDGYEIARILGYFDFEKKIFLDWLINYL